MSLDDFVTFSSELTGFTEFDLLGTGQAQSYLDTVSAAVGRQSLTELLSAYRQQVTELGDEQLRAEQLTRAVLDDPQRGPITRNIIKLWYCGIWFGLPGREGAFTASPQAYAEGLLWYAIGANPPGARAPGYGSWSTPPRIPALPPSPIPHSLIRDPAPG